MERQLSNSLMDVPSDLRDFASIRVSHDILDEGVGMGHIVVLECPDCRDGWGWHWSGVETAFRKHLTTCSKRKEGGHGETELPKAYTAKLKKLK